MRSLNVKDMTFKGGRRIHVLYAGLASEHDGAGVDECDLVRRFV
jgi:hypothetical protein